MDTEFQCNKIFLLGLKLLFLFKNRPVLLAHPVFNSSDFIQNVSSSNLHLHTTYPDNFISFPSAAARLTHDWLTL